MSWRACIGLLALLHSVPLLATEKSDSVDAALVLPVQFLLVPNEAAISAWKLRLEISGTASLAANSAAEKRWHGVAITEKEFVQQLPQKTQHLLLYLPAALLFSFAGLAPERSVVDKRLQLKFEWTACATVKRLVDKESAAQIEVTKSLSPSLQFSMHVDLPEVGMETPQPIIIRDDETSLSWRLDAEEAYSQYGVERSTESADDFQIGMANFRWAEGGMIQEWREADAHEPGRYSTRQRPLVADWQVGELRQSWRAD